MRIATYFSCQLSPLIVGRSVIEGRQLTLPDNILPAAAVGFLAGLVGYAWEGRGM